MQTPNPSADEIDLLQLIANLARFLGKNWLTIVLSMVICTGVSWWSYRGTFKVYASEMVVQAKFLSESYAAQVVKGLQDEINNDQDSIVASKLNLNPSEASLVENISVNSAFVQKSPTMLEEDKIIFVLSAEVSDPKVLPRLQAGLVHFFENLDYIKIRVSERKKSYQNLLSRIDTEIGRIEESPIDASAFHPMLPNDKKILKQRNENDKQIVNPLIFDPATISIYMTSQRNDVRERAALLFNGIEVIQGFSASKYPIKPKLSIYLASGFSAGVLLSAILLGLRSLQLLFKKYPA